MRHLLYFSVLIITISCINKKPKAKINLIGKTNSALCESSYFDTVKSMNNVKVFLNASLDRMYDTTLRTKVKYKAFDIKLSIINKSNKSFCFWIMTCDWRDNFIINNDYIDFLWDHSCDSNYPDEICIRPKECLVYNTSLIKKDHTRGQLIQPTKFGLIYIDSTKCRTDFDFENIIGDKSKHDIILWSNPLFLNDKN